MKQLAYLRFILACRSISYWVAGIYRICRSMWTESLLGLSGGKIQLLILVSKAMYGANLRVPPARVCKFCCRAECWSFKECEASTWNRPCITFQAKNSAFLVTNSNLFKNQSSAISCLLSQQSGDRLLEAARIVRIHMPRYLQRDRRDKRRHHRRYFAPRVDPPPIPA